MAIEVRSVFPLRVHSTWGVAENVLFLDLGAAMWYVYH